MTFLPSENFLERVGRHMPELTAVARAYFSSTTPKRLFQPQVNRNRRQLLIQFDETIVGLRNVS